MGSACGAQQNIITTTNNTSNTTYDALDNKKDDEQEIILPPVGIGILDKPTFTTPPSSPKNQNTSLEDLPPPPPPGCPLWQKLDKKQRYTLIKNEPLLAIQALDEYWLRKINKYVVNNKLPPLNAGKKGDMAWELMIKSQIRTQERRIMIWEEFMQTSFSDIINTSNSSTTKEETTTEVIDNETKSKDNGTERVPSSPGSNMSAMQSMRESQASNNQGIGVTSKKSAGVIEKSKVSIEKRQVEALGMLSETIRRMRRIGALLKISIGAKPTDEGRQVLYKRSLDHLLMLEELVEPFRRSKMNLDKMTKSLAKIQINAHAQQMKQWVEQEEAEKWDEEEGEEGESETSGLLSGMDSSNMMNPTLGQ